MVSEDKKNILAGRKLSFRKKEQLSKLAQQATGNDLITLYFLIEEDGAGGGVFLDQQSGISASAEMIHQAKVPERNDLHADYTQ